LATGRFGELRDSLAPEVASQMRMTRGEETSQIVPPGSLRPIVDLPSRQPESPRYFKDLLSAAGALAPPVENTHLASLFGHDMVLFECYVPWVVLSRRLTSESGARKKRATMITAISKALDTCAATGCHSPSRSQSLLGLFQPRVNTIEF